MINPLSNEWITTEDDRLCPLCRSQGAIWNAQLEAATQAVKAEEEIEPVLSPEQKSEEIQKMVSNSNDGILKDVKFSETEVIVPEQKALTEISTRVKDPFKMEIVSTGQTFGQVATQQQLLASPSLRQAANMIKPVFVGVDIAVGNIAKVVYKAGRYYVQLLDGNTKLISTSLGNAALRFNILEK